MTDTNNGWSGKPGVPLNPEKDGWHWFKTPDGLVIHFWGATFSECSEWDGYPLFIVREWTYLGPCLTHDEITRLRARVAELEDFCEDYLVRFELFHVTNTNEVFDGAQKYLVTAALEGKKQ